MEGRGSARRSACTHHFADPKGNTTFTPMAILIDCRAAIDKPIAAACYNSVFSHPLESKGEFSFLQNSLSAGDDFTGLI